MFKFIYKDKARKVQHELQAVHFNLEGLLDEFRSFLRGAGFEFSEQIVLEENEELCRDIDEIAEENEALRQEIKELRKKAQWDEAFRRKLEKEKQEQYDHWIAEVNRLQDELKKEKDSPVPLGVPINRVTVITREGREYETWLDDYCEFMLQYQDNGRTLKLFEVEREDVRNPV